MPTITIGSNNYDSYITVEYADEYLAADMARASAWDDVSADNKKRAVVSATRLLQRQSWVSGSAPEVDDPELPAVVEEATALLAADIAAKPALGDSGSTASNVKSVGAGSAKVEFFKGTDGTPLPSAAFALLKDLLGASPDETGSTDSTAFGSSDCQRSRFDVTDYRLLGTGPISVEPY